MALAFERRSGGGALLCAAVLALAAGPAAAAAGVPVKVRIIKGSRQGPPSFDPKLADVQHQLAEAGLAYQRWEQVGEQQFDLDFGKSASMPLPDGSSLELRLVSGQPNTVTFDVRLPRQDKPKRLTFSKEKRAVFRVSTHDGGDAFFATIRPWP
jgi:hypothetical protein